MRGSLLERLHDRCDKSGDLPATLHLRGGRVIQTSWAEWERRSRTLAIALIQLGVHPGDRVGILSETRVEWAWFDTAIMMSGAISVPIFPTEVPSYIERVLGATAVGVAIVSNPLQARKVLQVLGNVPALSRLVVLDGQAEDEDGTVVTLRELQEDSREGLLISVEEALDLGETHLSETTARLNGRIMAIKPTDIATICYTPGTEGDQKGVAVTHASMAAAGATVGTALTLGTRDVQLLYLPLAAAFARLSLSVSITVGATIAFARSYRTVLEDCTTYSPTFLCAVPRFFESVRARLLAERKGMPTVQRAALGAALKLADRMTGDDPTSEGMFAGLNRNVVGQLVVGPMRELFGGSLRFAISGGAALQPDTGTFFRTHGLEILEGYGMTETFATSHLNRPGDILFGTVGRPLDGMECQVDADGEVLLRGPFISACYWAGDGPVDSHLEDGWLRTGDLGQEGPEGRLIITDRKRDVINTANGKVIAPQPIVEALRKDALISQVLVHGENRNFLTALIALEPEAARELARSQGLSNLDSEELFRHSAIYQAVQATVDEVNAGLPSHAAIRKFAIVASGFTVESGDVTATEHLRRRTAESRHQSLLDSFYSEQY